MMMMMMVMMMMVLLIMVTMMIMRRRRRRRSSTMSMRTRIMTISLALDVAIVLCCRVDTAFGSCGQCVFCYLYGCAFLNIDLSITSFHKTTIRTIILIVIVTAASTSPVQIELFLRRYSNVI